MAVINKNSIHSNKRYLATACFSHKVGVRAWNGTLTNNSNEFYILHDKEKERYLLLCIVLNLGKSKLPEFATTGSLLSPRLQKALFLFLVIRTERSLTVVGLCIIPSPYIYI